MGKTRAKIALVKLVFERANAGVVFSPKNGALCPGCGKRTKIIRTMPWEESVRVRYHRCKNNSCILCGSGKTIKSVEEDIE